MNITDSINELNNSINDEVYCGLVDSGVHPEEAYKYAFGSEFDLEQDALEFPALNDTV